MIDVPTDVLTWILDRGLSAGLLVVAFILGIVVRAMRADEKQLHREIADLGKLRDVDMKQLQADRLADMREAAKRDAAAQREVAVALTTATERMGDLAESVEKLITAVEGNTEIVRALAAREEDARGKSPRGR